MSTGLQSESSLSPALAVRAMEVKAPGAFRTISEVATSLEVPQHVLRFWESKFQQVRPLKRGGGRRYYRREDVELLESIKDLLYNQGFTIRGVQKLLKENSRRATIVRPSAGEGAGTLVAVAPALQAPVAQTASSLGFSTKARREIESVLGELKTLRSILSQSGV